MTTSASALRRTGSVGEERVALDEIRSPGRSTAPDPPRRSPSYRPSRTVPLNHDCSRPLTSTATRPTRPRGERRRLPARPRSRARRRPRAPCPSSASDTSGESRSARDTVATETPARAATSAMVDRSSAPTSPLLPDAADVCKRSQDIRTSPLTRVRAHRRPRPPESGRKRHASPACRCRLRPVSGTCDRTNSAG